MISLGVDLDPKSMMDMTIVAEPVDIALGSSEKGNVSQPGKPRKKTMTSMFLRYFDTAADGKSRSCKFCGQTYSISTATGNLGRHLCSKHPGYDKSTDGVTCAVLQPATTIVKRPQAEAKPPKLDLDHLNWLLVKWLTSSSQPSGILEDNWLQNSFKFLNPSVQIWPSGKYQDVLHEIFRSMQEDVRATLDQVSSKVAITLEFWTSYEKIYYMGVTCHWIDESWSFQKILLDICHIPYPCGGLEIYNSLVKVLKLYNIEDKVLSCTHDSSQGAMHACSTLKDDMDAHKVGPFCYLPCAARTLNMIIEDGLRTTKPVLSKVREFVMEMNSSFEISDDFLRYTTAYQESNCKIPLDTSTRWSGYYQMLDLVWKANKSMDAVIRKHEATLENRMLLTSAEKNAISIIHGYLEPFYKTTNNICSDKAATVGLVLFFMEHISEMISSCRDSRHLPDWLKTTAEEMSKKSRTYNTQVFNIFTYMTAILDPRIKTELIPETLNLDSHLEEARTHFIRNYSALFYNAPHENENGGSVSFAEEIARKKRRVSMSNSCTDELSQYLSEPPAALATDVLEWWKMNMGRYPRLSMMARDFLPVQAMSSPPDELFCGKGDEVEKHRFCMSKGMMRVLLCVKSWSDNGFRLRCKATEIDYDRIMELAVRGTGEIGNAFGIVSNTHR